MSDISFSEARTAKVKEIFAKAGAIITGSHFVYAKKPDGWYHGSDYVNKDAIYLFTDLVSELCQEISRYFWESKIEAVVGPAIGGVALSQWTAHCLGHVMRHDILAVFADEEDVLEETFIGLASGTEFNAFGKVKIFSIDGDVANIVFFEKTRTRRVIKRGYDKHVKGKKCLIVEDVISSGATVVKTIVAIHQAGGEVVGVGCLCNRSGGKVTAKTLGVPELFSLLDSDMQMYPEADCPICREKGPESVRTDLGKGKEFLSRIRLACV
ncbi:MAG: phosphoribosyltransferase family protein [Patescibacteria group bacterium]